MGRDVFALQFMNGKAKGKFMQNRTNCFFRTVFIVQISIMVVSMRAESAEVQHSRHGVKNVIFMVPDGMGLPNVMAARIFKNGINGENLAFETLDEIGYQRTYSADSGITDSAAAASAWACGEKFNSGEISCHDDNSDGICDEGTLRTTILEIAKQMGKSTGLVTTTTLTNATPAVWGAHVHNRYCEYSIAEQYIKTTGVDVLLGGGIARNRGSCMLEPSTNEQIEALVLEAQENYGYALASSIEELDDAVSSGQRKIIGRFKSGNKTSELFRVDPDIAYPENEPTLPDMTEAALDVLEKNHRGFFLMVEGGLIDYANHANNLDYQVAEVLAFEESVELILDWIKQKPSRQKDTLLVIAVDHETGGFAINGPSDGLPGAGELVEDAWTTGNHTGVDTMIWSMGPGSENLGRAIENSDVYDIIVSRMR